MSLIYLLDTTAISEAVKSRRDDGYMNWLNSADDSSLYISCISIGEIQKGISLAKDSKVRNKLDNYMAGLYEAFAGRILDLDVNDAALWGILTAKAQQSGLMSPVVDTFLAAQCLRRNLVLVTRNVKDFKQFKDLEVLCPWS